MPYVAVALGGCLGACARYGMTLWLGSVPWTIWLINILGSFTLTWLYTISQERIHLPPNLRLGIGTGFIGSFTTFSTFTADGWRLWASGRVLEAITYVGLSILIGCWSALWGYRLALWQTRLQFSDDITKDA
jgi:fluoride exporter